MSTSGFLYRSGIIDNHCATLTDKSLLILLTLAPFFYMTVQGTIGVTYFLMVVLAVTILWVEPESRVGITSSSDFWLILISLGLPLLSIFISETARMELQAQSFDGPSRLLLGVPIFLIIYAKRINYSKLLSLTLPMALAFTWAYAALNEAKFGARLSVDYSNPILWGDFAIIHGFICLFSVKSTDSLLKKLYLYSGLFIGITMSMISQSRGGWVAGMLLLMIWLGTKRREVKLHQQIFFGITTVCLLILVYLFVETFHIRINQGFLEIKNWFEGKNVDTGTGIRLSMWKISLYSFMQRPWFGYGDHGLTEVLNDPYILSFASKESLSTIQGAGPHNELIAELLRSGIFGILSYAGKFLIPLYLFIKLYLKNKNDNPAAMQGICLVLGCIVCGFSVEILSLKYIYSYYALSLAALMGEALKAANFGLQSPPYLDAGFEPKPI